MSLELHVGSLHWAWPLSAPHGLGDVTSSARARNGSAIAASRRRVPRRVKSGMGLARSARSSAT